MRRWNLHRAGAGLLLLCALAAALAGCGGSGTPNGMKRENVLDEYVEDIVDFRLFVPQDWVVRMASGIVTASADEMSSVNLSMTAFSLSGSPTVEEQWGIIKAEFEKTYAGFTVLAEPNFEDEENLSHDPCVTKIAGEDAIFCDYDAKIGGNPCRYRIHLFIHDGYLYVLTYSATETFFEGGKEDLARILSALTFDRKASAPDGMKAASAAEGRFVSSEDYRFFVPSDWETDTGTGVYTARFGGGLPTAFTVMTDPLEDANISMSDYFDSFKDEFNESFPGWKLDSGPTEATLPGSEGSLIPALEYEYTVPLDEEGEVAAYRYCQVLCKREDRMILLTFSTTENYYDDHIEHFTKILDNFVITE